MLAIAIASACRRQRSDAPSICPPDSAPAMACPDENTLVAFASGTLRMVDAAAVEEHLDACPVCFTLVAELARTDLEDAEPTRMVAIDAVEPEPEPDAEVTQHAAVAASSDAELPTLALPVMPPRTSEQTVIAPAPTAPPPSNAAGEVEELDDDPALRSQPTVVVLSAVPTPVRPQRPAAPPSHLGRYTLLHRIGIGELGAVYAAEDRESHQRVALRLLTVTPPMAGADPPWLFASRTLAQLHHDHVARVFDAATHDGQPYIATELLEGVTLAQWMRATPRGWREITAKFVDAARGLAAAHGLGVVHGAFRPSKVMVDLHGRVRVIDFGLGTNNPFHDEARTVVRGNPLDGGGDELPIGERTQIYAAPEQYEGRTEPSVDQFALCAALFEALFERPPFDAPDPDGLRARVLSGLPPDIPLRTAVPGWLVNILLRGLARDRERRFASLDAWIEAVEGAQRRRGHLGRAALAGGAVVVAGAIGLAIVRAGPDGPCARDEPTATQTWDDDTRARISRVVEGSSWGTTIWESTQRMVDREVASWASLRAATCEADDGVETAKLSCLSQWRGELAAFAGAWRSVGASEVPLLLESALALGSPARCLDRHGEVDVAASQLTAIDERLAHARAQSSLGQLDRAGLAAATALQSATSLGARAQQGEAELVRARILRAHRQLGDAEAALAEAVQAGLAAEDAGLVLRASVRAADLASEQGQFERARAHLAVARGAFERVPHDLWGEIEIAYQDGVAALAAGQWDAAMRSFAAVQNRLREAGVAEDLRVALAASGAARARAELGDLDGALADATAALALARELTGDAHPLVARLRLELAEVQARADRFAEADATLDAVLASRTVLEAPKGELAAQAWLLRGRVAWSTGSLDRAAEDLEHALESGRAALGERAPAVGEAWAQLARVRKEQSLWPQAELAATAALAVIDPAASPDAYAHARIVVADVMWAREEHEAADAIVAATLRTLEGVGAASSIVAPLTAWRIDHPIVVVEP